MSGYLIKVSKNNGKYQVNTRVPEQILFAWKLTKYLDNNNEQVDGPEIGKVFYLSIDTPPSSDSEFRNIKVVEVRSDNSLKETSLSILTNDSIRPNAFTAVNSGLSEFWYQNNSGVYVHFARENLADFKLWETNEFVETTDDTSRIDYLEGKVKDLNDKINGTKLKIQNFTLSNGDRDYNNGDIFEFGTSLPNLTASWEYSTSGNPQVQRLSVNNSTYAIDSEGRTYSFSSPIPGTEPSKTFVVEFTNDDGSHGGSDPIILYFKRKVYWGAAPLVSDLNSDFIARLGNSRFADNTAGEYSFNLDSNEKYGYFAYPKSWGEIRSWGINDFDVDVVKVGEVLFGNNSAVPYTVIRTTQPGLGEFDIELKDAKNNTGVQQ